MNKVVNYDDRIANMLFNSVYPYYVEKIEKKWRSIDELLEVISWLTGYDNKKILDLTNTNISFQDFFKNAKINPKSKLITWVICWYRVEDIQNPLTQKVRYLDKLVDELAKWKKMEKILRNK